MTKKPLSVILGAYRSGSTSLAHDISIRKKSINHNEYFGLRYNDKQELNFDDHDIPEFEENDVVKIMGDILYFYPRLLNNLEMKYDINYFMIYRRDFYSQLISFIKPKVANDKFANNVYYADVPYPEPLILDLQKHEDLLLDRAAGLLRTNIGLDRYFDKASTHYIYEDYYTKEKKYNQPHKLVRPMTDTTKQSLIDLFNSTKLSNIKIELNIHD
jgi:hypothetical protein